MKRTVAVAAAAGMAMETLANDDSNASNKAKFNLKYAPNFGAFPQMGGKEPIDFIKFCNDQGFRAIFDNGLMGKKPALQEKIAAELRRHNMDIGPFVVRAKKGGQSMVYADSASREAWKQGLYDVIETSKRTHAKQALIVPGND